MFGMRKSQQILSKNDKRSWMRFFKSNTSFEWFGGPSELIENIILCSGQGFQYVGMFLDLERNKRMTVSIADLMRKANNVLGYDIVRLCIEGPKSKLDKTIHCQPAVVLASLVGAELMKKYKPWYLGTNPKIAGYSVGEIAALCVAESITVEEAFFLTKARAEAMQRACDITASGLFFVHGLKKEDLQERLTEIVNEKGNRKKNFETVLDIVIDSYPKGHVVGATVDCNDAILALNSEQVQVTELPVSGAFHTRLMAYAQPIFKEALDKTEIKIPKYDVYSNVTGDVYKSPDEIKSLLVRQIAEPVQWQLIVQKIYKRAANSRTCELGSGHQLKSMFAKYNRRIIRRYFNFSV